MIRRGNHYICILFVICSCLILMTGCGKKATSTVSQTIEVIQESDGKQDINIQMDDVILKVENKQITYREVLFYVYQVLKSYQDNLGENVWDVKLDTGVSFENYTKENILKELTELKIIVQEALQEGVALSEDELVDVRKQASKFINNVSAEDINKFGFKKDMITNIYADHALAGKMFDIITGKTAIDILDEDVQQHCIEYLKVSTQFKESDGKQMEMTSEQKKEILKRVKKLYKQAGSTNDFYSFAKKHTDAEEVRIVFGKDEKPEEFGEQAIKLKKGELSSIIKGAKGYYIVYCVDDNDEDATREKKEQLMNSNQNEMFQKQYTAWSKKFSVEVSTGLWKRLTIKEITIK